MFVSVAVSQITTISIDMIFAFWIMDYVMLWHAFRKKMRVTGFAPLLSVLLSVLLMAWLNRTFK